MFENKEQFCAFLKLIGYKFTMPMISPMDEIFGNDRLDTGVLCCLLEDYFGYKKCLFSDVSNWNYLYGTDRGTSLCGMMFGSGNKFVRVSIRTYGQLLLNKHYYTPVYIEFGYKNKCIGVYKNDLKGISALIDFILDEKVDVA